MKTVSNVELFEYLNTSYNTIEGLEEGFISSIIDKVKSSVISTFKDVDKSFGLFSDFLYNLGTINTPKQIKKIKKNFRKDINPIPYSSVYKFETLTLQGLRVPLSEVSGYILAFFTELDNKSIFKSLDELDTKISKYISKNDYRRSFKNDNSDMKDFKKKLLDNPRVNFLKAINPSDKLEYKRVEDLVNSNSDFEKTLDILIDIDSKINDKDILNINKTINKIYKKLQILHEQLDEGLDFSKNSLESLIELIDMYSKLMTTISMYFYVYTKVMEVIIELEKTYKR